MKRIITILLVAAVLCSVNTHAQRFDRSLYVSTDTSSDADTVIIPFEKIGSGVKAFQATVTKLSGTVGGKVYLEGTIDGNWIKLDSMSNSNTTTNTKVFMVTATSYYSYRINYISTGTQSSIIRAAYMRRPDE